MTWENGFVQRHQDCLPFVLNITLRGIIEVLWKRLRATIGNLHAHMPTDEQAVQWMKEYGNDDSVETLRFTEGSQ